MRITTRGVSAVFYPVLAAIALSSCSTEDPARDAVERELAVTVTLGQFDVERGQMMSSTVHVVIDGDLYPLVLAEEAVFLGLGDLTRMELGGRMALISGKVVNGVYEATYAKLLPENEPGLNSAAQVMDARLEDLKNQLMALNLELQELDYALFQLPEADDETKALLEAKIDVANSRVDELTREYEARLQELESDR